MDFNCVRGTSSAVCPFTRVKSKITLTFCQKPVWCRTRSISDTAVVQFFSKYVESHARNREPVKHASQSDFFVATNRWVHRIVCGPLADKYRTVCNYNNAKRKFISHKGREEGHQCEREGALLRGINLGVAQVLFAPPPPKKRPFWAVQPNKRSSDLDLDLYVVDHWKRSIFFFLSSCLLSIFFI